MDLKICHRASPVFPPPKPYLDLASPNSLPLPSLIMWQHVAQPFGTPGSHGMCLGFRIRVHAP